MNLFPIESSAKEESRLVLADMNSTLTSIIVFKISYLTFFYNRF